MVVAEPLKAAELGRAPPLSQGRLPPPTPLPPAAFLTEEEEKIREKRRKEKRRDADLIFFSSHLQVDLIIFLFFISLTRIPRKRNQRCILLEDLKCTVLYSLGQKISGIGD